MYKEFMYLYICKNKVLIIVTQRLMSLKCPFQKLITISLQTCMDMLIVNAAVIIAAAKTKRQKSHFKYQLN